MKRRVTLDEAREAKEKLEELLADQSKVQAIGIARNRKTKDYYVKITLFAEMEKGESLPKKLDGVEITTETIDRFGASLLG